jgi:hypothetical protein
LKQFLPLSSPCRCILKKIPELQLEVYGYPPYKENYQKLDKLGERITLNQYGLTGKDSIVDIDPKTCSLQHSISTLGGQSGCPIVID